MEITAKSHVPVCQYGFIELDHLQKEEDKDAFFQTVVEDFKRVQDMYNGKKIEKPKKEGDTVEENGHIYKAVKNEKTGEIYWLIDKI